MSITFAEALAKLNDPANAAQYSTIDGIKSLVAETSGEVFNGGVPSTAERLLYNGLLPDGAWASDVAKTLANDGSGKFVNIYQSEVGQLLESTALKERIAQVNGGILQDSPEFKTIMGGSYDTATGIRTNGLWDMASTNYVTDTAHGDFRILVDKPTVGSIKRCRSRILFSCELNEAEIKHEHH